ncbi:MAG: TolC family protein [Chitinispirillales bacterium]|jgi:outer membrane protein TolC|nr:TolC family protein [Chitinispirillales bacterium]
MMRKFCTVAVIATAVLLSVAYADDSAAVSKTKHPLSLQESLQRALKDNPLVKIERINTDIAASIVKENDVAMYDPVFRAAYDISDRLATSSAPPTPNALSHDLSLSISESLPTGTDIEFAMRASGTSSSSYRAQINGEDSVIQSAGKYQNSASLTVTQALLQGRGKSANLVTLQKSRIDMNIRKEELAAYALKLLSDTERAYWDLLSSGEQMGIYTYSLELAQRLLYESEERLNIGGIAPIELVAIRAEVASRERQLFDAQTAYRQKALTLAYLMNAPDLMDAELLLTDSAGMELGDADGVDEHITAAKSFRPDYLQAFMQAQKGELDLIQTQNGLLPRLDFHASLTGVTDAGSPKGVAPGAGDKFSPIIAAGLTLRLPIRNNSAKERYRRSEFSMDQQRLSIENYVRLIDYEIRGAHIEVQRARRQIETAKTVSALQLQKLEAEHEKMNAGKSTGYAVLQVQRDLVSANLDAAQARTSYVAALLTLYSKDGTFLQRRGVTF